MVDEECCTWIAGRLARAELKLGRPQVDAVRGIYQVHKY
jgi:hypothetical protein